MNIKQSNPPISLGLGKAKGCEGLLMRELNKTSVKSINSFRSPSSSEVGSPETLVKSIPSSSNSDCGMKMDLETHGFSDTWNMHSVIHGYGKLIQRHDRDNTILYSL